MNTRSSLHTLLPALKPGESNVRLPKLTAVMLAGASASAITNLVTMNVLSAGEMTCWTNGSPVNPAFYRLWIAP